MALKKSAEEDLDYLMKSPIHLELHRCHLKEVKKEIELFQRRLVRIQEKSSVENRPSHTLCLSIINQDNHILL